KDVEDREQALLGLARAGDRPGFDEVARPALFAQIQKREHELVLGGEVAIQRRLGDPRPSDHFVDADRPNPAPATQLIRAAEDALPRLSAPYRGLKRLHHDPHPTIRQTGLSSGRLRRGGAYRAVDQEGRHAMPSRETLLPSTPLELRARASELLFARVAGGG